MIKINRFYLCCTIFYVAFLLSIIILANLGIAPSVFKAAKLFQGGDKISHLILMGLFSYFLNSALYCKKIEVGKYKIFLGSLFVYLLVLGEELSQFFIPFRSADLGDALSDMAGIFLFGILAEKNLSLKTFNGLTFYNK